MLRKDSSTGYGLRFPAEIYGNKREKTVFHGNLQEVKRVVLCCCREFRTPASCMWLSYAAYSKFTRDAAYSTSTRTMIS